MATSSNGKGFRSKPWGKPQSGIPRAVGLSTLTSFWQLLQPSQCQIYCCALLWTTLVGPREGICQLGIPGSPYISHRLVLWRGHSSANVHSSRNNTGGYSHVLQVQTNWHSFGLKIKMRSMRSLNPPLQRSLPQDTCTCLETLTPEWEPIMPPGPAASAHFGIGRLNENGQRLFELCSYHDPA